MLRKSHSSEWNVFSNTNSITETAAHSMALQQHFEELKTELADFNSIFSSWTSSRRQVLTDDKDAYLRTLAEEQDLVEALKKQLAFLVAKRQHIVAELQAEQREYEEGLKANSELETQRHLLTRKLGEMKDKATRLSQEVVAHQMTLAEQEESTRSIAFKNLLEVTLGREKSGLAVDSVEENVTKFTFKYIDPTDWEKTFIVTIDVSTSRYRVKNCEPMIPHLSSLVMNLEEDGDFYSFLRRIRQSFVDMTSPK